VSNDNDIQAFDQIFKNQLEKASVNPPAGLWESIASQTAPIKTISTASKWGATWIKGVLLSGTITIGSVAIYQYLKPLANSEINTPIVLEKSETTAPLQAEDETQFNDESTTKSSVAKNIKTDKTSINIEPKLGEEVNKMEVNNSHSTNKIIPIPGVLNIPSNFFPTIIPSTTITKVENLQEENNYQENNSEIVPTLDDESKTKSDNSVLNIPNAVTPNGDGLNDTYFIEIQGEEYFEMIIYNEKMEKLFETKSKYKSWDCKLPNGDLAPAGNYMVFLKYKFYNQEFESQYIKLKIIK
jgi:gliding motility-associated-like protein